MGRRPVGSTESAPSAARPGGRCSPRLRCSAAHLEWWRRQPPPNPGSVTRSETGPTGVVRAVSVQLRRRTRTTGEVAVRRDGSRRPGEMSGARPPLSRAGSDSPTATERLRRGSGHDVRGRAGRVGRAPGRNASSGGDRRGCRSKAKASRVNSRYPARHAGARTAPRRRTRKGGGPVAPCTSGRDRRPRPLLRPIRTRARVAATPPARGRPPPDVARAQATRPILAVSLMSATTASSSRSASFLNRTQVFPTLAFGSRSTYRGAT